MLLCFFFIRLKPGFESDYNKEIDRISEESSFAQSPVKKTKMKIGNHAFRQEQIRFQYLTHEDKPQKNALAADIETNGTGRTALVVRKCI